ncbi:MAG: ATP phosphoribosyltransferase regulatory subunit [Deltaproteobacteria bacterium]|nr:ATP phosphoribosyltransferase regulatory subunit [Deltaproteobacteria bacterium]
MSDDRASGTPSGVRLPAGVSDYPPGRAAALDSCLAGLNQVFESYGYRRVYTPWFELLGSLERGLSGEAQARLFHLVDPGSGEILVLRPDFTAQVARMVAARMSAGPRPLRLAYHGRVARAVDALGRGLSSRDLFQAGIELIGAAGPVAEREVLTIATAAFAKLGRTLTLDLSHAGILAALAPEGLDAPTRLALSARDEVALAQRAPQLLPLLKLHGGPEVLRRAAAELQGAPRSVTVALEELQGAIDGLTRTPPTQVSVDLAEVRGFGDYTGLVFRGYTEGAADAVVSGGRYDRLLGRFGKEEAAVGFGIDVGAVLLGQTPPPRRGVVIAGQPGDPASEDAALAHRARGEPTVVVEPSSALAYAEHHGYRLLVTGDGVERSLP